MQKEIRDQEFDELYMSALLLSKVISRILKQKAEIALSAKPALKVVDIVEFMKRMRVWSLDKFNDVCYISSVNFYRCEDDMVEGKPAGVIVLYIGEEYIVSLMKKLGYPLLDEDDVESLKDACGTFCNLIAAKFKAGLTQLGYIDLIMSHFSSYQNEVIGGVEYDLNEKKKYEISFEINNEKRIVIELTMGKLPKTKSS